MSFSLKLFGGVALTGDGGPVSGPAVQRHRLALLALLAASRPRAVSRDKLMALLWPERDSEPARRLLNQAVHALRQSLGADAILSTGEELQLNPGVLNCDVFAFEDALARGDQERAVGLYAGPFLDGFFLDEAPEFGRWVDRERDRLAGACARALEALAESAERAGDAAGAVEQWKARAAHDPYDSRVALRLMQALHRAGNRAGALHHAALHQQRLRDELELEPSPDIGALAERLRREPAPAGPAQATAGGSGLSPSPAGEVPPRAVTAVAAPPPGGPSPGPRRTLRYAGAAVLVAFAAAGAMRLAPRRLDPAGVTSPKVLDEIAQAVTRELDRRNRGDTGRMLPQHRTRSIAAYELYLRGSDPALLRSDSAARLGLDYFRRAIALDSSYAAAWVGVARFTVRTSSDDVKSVSQAWAQAERAVRTALALDDSLAEAHALFGVIRANHHDYIGAESHLRRAIALEPGLARIREWFVSFLLLTGRPAEALAEAERALSFNPLSPSSIAEVARALSANGRCDEALARLETIANLDPPLLRAAPIAAECYARRGQWEAALAALRPMAGREAASDLALLGYMRAGAGQRQEALALQERLLTRYRRGEIGAYYLAFVPAGLGDRDQAFTWLDRAGEDGSMRFYPAMRVGLSGAPFDALRSDPRLDRLRVRLGLQKR